jgi:hypothetical protein
VAKNAFGMISPTFVEAVHVELPYEGIHFAVTKVFGQDHLLEFSDVFDNEL